MMTSNVASSRWSGRHENHEEDRIQRTVLAACVDMFAPEFRGRLTSTLLFRPLSPETSERIVVRELDALNAQSGLVERGLQAMWADDVPARVAQVGMSPSHGGRGIQRAVRGMVATPLAHWLAEKPSARDGIVHMAFTGGHGKVGSAVIDFLASGAPCPDAVMWN
jgi:ATP-dependent Clp protease ATP-binding subunit ClpA